MPGNSFSHDRSTYGCTCAMSQTSVALYSFGVTALSIKKTAAFPTAICRSGHAKFGAVATDAGCCSSVLRPRHPRLHVARAGRDVRRLRLRSPAPALGSGVAGFRIGLAAAAPPMLRPSADVQPDRCPLESELLADAVHEEPFVREMKTGRHVGEEHEG